MIYIQNHTKVADCNLSDKFKRAHRTPTSSLPSETLTTEEEGRVHVITQGLEPRFFSKSIFRNCGGTIKQSFQV